jgi:hypothetical protein
LSRETRPYPQKVARLPAWESTRRSGSRSLQRRARPAPPRLRRALHDAHVVLDRLGDASHLHPVGVPSLGLPSLRCHGDRMRASIATLELVDGQSAGFGLRGSPRPERLTTRSCRSAETIPSSRRWPTRPSSLHREPRRAAGKPSTARPRCRCRPASTCRSIGWSNRDRLDRSSSKGSSGGGPRCWGCRDRPYKDRRQ